MAKLTDMQIRAWVRAGERFDGRSDGNGLYLRYRETDKIPVWRFRYKIVGKSKVMVIGSYADLSLAKAREAVKELSARVSLGYDVAGEKQERKAAIRAKREEQENEVTVSEMATAYYTQQILGRVKRPQFVKQQIDKDINPHLGMLSVRAVTPLHIDMMLQAVVSRGAKSAANKVLGVTRRIFDYAIKRRYTDTNPTAAFDASDTGGPAKSRERWLTREELIQFFQAMRMAKGFSRQNEISMKLLLSLCCRKMELCGALWAEFDLDRAVWHLPAERTKNGDAIDIPLPPPVVEWFKELQVFSCGSAWVLPARAVCERELPHIADSTLPVALSKVQRLLADMPHFTIHDFRRTARTHLAALGVDPVVAERCLNHRIQGVEGIYNRHQYFDERRAGITLWADLLVALERGEDYNVVSIAQRK
ncbi:tyrosine-type recombinase/integrase [Yersinia pseudotuberculosis]|uniref:tyrosine-type recombinase/integrase n=1 Tax=Yersinia pseudotuberculosis TaxID=633 RepID=UPI0005E82AC8|nr:site-specific integrase [Yersinia pseudotuberculosis]CND45611.1 phage integrase family site specific recombinase [Yersinia pseudotuberculosis]